MQHAFDARKTWLAEGKIVGTWRTVSLVTAVRALADFGRGPHGPGRARLMLDCLAELTARGIDGDSLLRFGLAPEVIAPLVYRQILRSTGMDWSSLGVPEGAVEGLDGWDDLLGNPDDGSAPVGALLESVTPAFLWAMSASLDDLVGLTPPSRVDFEKFLTAPPPDPDLIQKYRWLVDRFSTTRIQEWETTSLHLEYECRAGDLPSLCPHDLLLDRPVEDMELNAEIAARSVRPRLHPPSLYGGALAQQMQRRAEELLRDGQPREAVALFEFALTQDETDAIALNNLAFCQLVDDPQTATTNLQRARALGYRPLVVNVYNEVFAGSLLDRPRHALAVADDHWRTLTSGVRPPQGAVLWRRSDGGELALVTVPDCRMALADLCVELAARIDDDHVATWGRRRASLVSS